MPEYFLQNNFSQDSFDACDEPTKQVIIKLLESRGFKVKDNTLENRYAVDIKFGINSDDEFDLDVENRGGRYWRSGPNFPFSTISIPYRKAKYVHPKFLYAVVNGDLSYALFCSAKSLTTVITKNTTRSNSEQFYDVPLSEFVLVELQTDGKTIGV